METTVIRRGEVSTWKQCRRKSWYKRRQRLVPKRKPLAFKLGDLAHGFWEELFNPPVSNAKKRAWMRFAELEDELLAVDPDLFLDTRKMSVILEHYFQYYWKSDRARFKFVETEKEVKVPIYNSQGIRIPGYELGCRWDVLLQDKATKKYWIMDHKTSATGSADDVLLDIGDQQNLYHYAGLHTFGDQFAGLIWDIVKKSKKGITKKDLKLAEKSGEDPADIFLGKFDSEIAEDPKQFFNRRPLRRTASDIKMIRDELYQAVTDMIEADEIEEITPQVFYRCPSLECRRCGYSLLCVRDNSQMRKAEYEVIEEQVDEEGEEDE